MGISSLRQTYTFSRHVGFRKIVLACNSLSSKQQRVPRGCQALSQAGVVEAKAEAATPHCAPTPRGSLAQAQIASVGAQAPTTRGGAARLPGESTGGRARRSCGSTIATVLKRS